MLSGADRTPAGRRPEIRTAGVPPGSSSGRARAVSGTGCAPRGTVLAGVRHNGGVSITREERTKRETDLRELLDLMRPAVQADGGDLELVSLDVESGVVEVQLQGACSSCAISSTTLQGGVDRILRGRLDWVTEVIGGVDESADPYESAALGQGAYVPKF